MNQLINDFNAKCVFHYYVFVKILLNILLESIFLQVLMLKRSQKQWSNLLEAIATDNQTKIKTL